MMKWDHHGCSCQIHHPEKMSTGFHLQFLPLQIKFIMPTQLKQFNLLISDNKIGTPKLLQGIIINWFESQLDWKEEALTLDFKNTICISKHFAPPSKQIMVCKFQVELAVSHMVQPLLKQHKVDFAKTRRCQLRIQKHTVRNEHGFLCSICWSAIGQFCW